RDILVDANSGLNTLATSFGVSWSKRFAMFCSLMWYFSIVWRIVETSAWAELVPYTALFVLLNLAVSKIDSSRSELYFVFCFEGLILVYSTVFILLQMLA